MEKNQAFVIHGTNDKLWNLQELIGYLNKNQHQHVSLRINPEAVCLETLGVYRLLDNFEFKQVDIHTENPLELHDRYNIIIQTDKSWLTKKQKIDAAFHTWNTKKIFFCLFARPTAARLGIASYLYKKFNSNSHIHFSATLNPDNLSQYRLDKLLEYDTTSISRAGDLINDLPLLLAPSDRYTATNGYYYDDKLTNFYQDILIDLVVESHVTGNTFYPTEKTVRPMWLKKPFIIFASKDYLDYLHQLGFKTFQTPTSDFWSEDYDGYEGRERYVRILALIDELSKKSKEELQEMYQAMQPILDHNYNLLKTQSYNNVITKII
jgi:hypothetical protein